MVIQKDPGLLFWILSEINIEYAPVVIAPMRGEDQHPFIPERQQDVLVLDGLWSPRCLSSPLGYIDSDLVTPLLKEIHGNSQPATDECIASTVTVNILIATYFHVLHWIACNLQYNTLQYNIIC